MAFMPKNHPDQARVVQIATEEAAREGVTFAEVMGPGLQRAPVRARKAAWLRILRETGCSMTGLAKVWGCGHYSILRVVQADRAARGELAEAA